MVAMSDRFRFGLPSEEKLKEYRIWDSYFTPAVARPGRDGKSLLLAEVRRSERAIELGHFEKLCLFPHVGIGTTTDPAFEELVRQRPEIVLAPFQLMPDRFLGMIQLNAEAVPASLDAINRWVRDDRMCGVYFRGGGPGALPCSDRRVIPLVERIAEVKGAIMQHTWEVTGGKSSPGHSTPAELAVLAARFPEQKFICAHAGGEWEKGIRAVRDSPNILIETSGFDATAGFIEMAVRELGENRIVFGSHLPSRSLGTELGKVIGADVSDEVRKKILGENFRRLLEMA